jgi:adenine-specific DNA-methyltransferase
LNRQEELFSVSAQILSDKPKKPRESAQHTVPLPRFPATRYQGSKRKMLSDLKQVFDRLEFNSCVDLFSGTGTVTLLFRLLGKRTTSNDFLAFNRSCAGLFQTVTRDVLASPRHAEQLNWLIHEAPIQHRYVQQHYAGIFFLDSENEEIDRFTQNIGSIGEPFRNLYIYAFGQALLKKRPYNLFHRANLGMRTKDVKRSFGNAVTWETPALEHAIGAIAELRQFPFTQPIPHSIVTGVNTNDVTKIPNDVDLVYMDPPYVNSRGLGVDYSDFYGFLEGLCDLSLYESHDASYPHKPVARQYSSWVKADSALYELGQIRDWFRNSIVVMSYRSDGMPVLSQIVEVLSAGGRSVEVLNAGGYKYALSQSKTSDEVVVISSP